MPQTKTSQARWLAMASRCAYPDARDQIEELELDSWQPFGTGVLDGFVGSTGKRVVLSFRGSTFAQGDFDTLTWLDKVFTDWSAGMDLAPRQLHSGQVQGVYLDRLREVWPEISRLLADHGAKDKKLWITGHGIGGALACVSGAMCRWENEIEAAGVFTYGAVKVADEAFARNYPVPLTRFENRNDIMPHLPPVASLVKLLRVLSADVEEALDRWFGSQFLEIGFAPVGRLQYLERRKKPKSKKDENQRLVGLVSAIVLDKSQLLQDHWIDSYCAAIDAV